MAAFSGSGFSGPGSPGPGPDPASPEPGTHEFGLPSGSTTDPAAALAGLLSAQGCARAPLRIAYSGGPDSTLLLALAAERGPRRRVRALHVDHGWHAESAAWAEHCRGVARRLGVACEVIRVDARPQEGEGPEAAARAARYAALRARMARGMVLLTAHHADDQAETALFALLRGGGIHGLAGMPAAQRLGPGLHLRPFLSSTQADLRAALAARDLPWIDDPANRDRRYDRVFLREQILPLLRERWPGIDTGLVRSARLAAEAVELESALAAQDYVHCRGAGRRGAATLDAAALCALPVARQRVLVRWWLRREGLAVPPERRLASALNQIATARAGRNPRIAWSGGELRRWDGRVWALRPSQSPVPGERFPWSDPGQPLQLPERRIEPDAVAALLANRAACSQVTLVRRRGGERLRPAGGGRERALTDLLRAAGLPPWEREAALLLFIDDRLAGVFAGGVVLRAAAAASTDS